MNRVLIVFGIALTVLAGPGCSRSGIGEGPILKGRLVANGNPYSVERLGGLEIKFLTVEGEGPQKKSYLAEIEKEGTFKVTTAQGGGIPPGQYKITIQCDPVTGKDGRWHDALRGAFTDQTSTLVYEVKQGVSDLTIDLEKKTVE